MFTKEKTVVFLVLAVICFALISATAGCDWVRRQENFTPEPFTGSAETATPEAHNTQPTEAPTGSGDSGQSTPSPEPTEEPEATPKISPNKVREFEEYSITEPTAEQSRVITVYRQLYPEYKDSTPLCNPLYNDGGIFFVPKEWLYAYYPAVTGKTVFYQIDNYNVCAFIQTIGEKGKFRFGVFDENYTLMSEVLSGIPLFEGKIWPHKIIERNEMRYLIVEYYYGWHGIRNSETVIYALPSLEKVWSDSEIFRNDPGSEFDQFRFAINGDYLDVYEFVYHNGWMEETFKTRIKISEIDLP